MTNQKRLDSRFEADLRRVRERGFSWIVDGTVKGVAALAAPVFDGFGKMVLALTAIGPSATLEADPDSKPAREQARCAAAISAQLGARPAEAMGG